MVDIEVNGMLFWYLGFSLLGINVYLRDIMLMVFVWMKNKNFREYGVIVVVLIFDVF